MQNYKLYTSPSVLEVKHLCWEETMNALTDAILWHSPNRPILATVHNNDFRTDTTRT